MTRHGLAAAAAATIISVIHPAVATAASQPPATWDNLVNVKAKRLDLVYLLPGADFRPYTKVMLDPTEVAFRKNWVRDYNSTASMGMRVSDADAQKVVEAASTGFGDVFAKAYREGGYEVVQAPGPDVLRVRTAVINLAISAPDVATAGRSRVYAREAGEATLVLEARDSLTGAILGRAVDRRIAGDTMAYLRSSVTNRSDFSRLFQSWAKESVAGLTELKRLSPVDVATVGTRK